MIKKFMKKAGACFLAAALLIGIAPLTNVHAAVVRTLKFEPATAAPGGNVTATIVDENGNPINNDLARVYPNEGWVEDNTSDDTTLIRNHDAVYTLHLGADEKSKDIFMGLVPSSGTDVEAHFTGLVEPYHANVRNGSGGGDYAPGATVNITANPPAAGKLFDKWTVISGGVTLDNANASSTSFTMPKNNVDVSATYKDAPKHTVTVTGGTGGGEYAEGATVRISANPASNGMRFKEWQVSFGSITLADKTSQTTSFTMPTTNVVVSASYEPIPKHTVTVTNGTGSGEYEEGATVDIAANPPTAGQRFKEWTVVSGGVTLADAAKSSTSFTLSTSNVEVTASYEDIPKYTVTVTNGTGSGSYEEGKTVTISANAPATGKRFKEWTVTSGGVTLADAAKSTTSFAMPASAVEVTATYEDIPKYTVTVINGTGFGDYEKGKTVTISANEPATGKRFKEWTVTSGGVTLADAAKSTTSFTMPASAVEVTATYEDAPLTITANGSASHQIGTGKDMTFTCSGKLNDLAGIYVDNNLVTSDHYTVKDGSTILTLKSSYLDTLSAGKHTLKFQYNDNVSAETSFTITPKAAANNAKGGTAATAKAANAKTAAPKTGDTANTMLLLGLLALSAGATVITENRRKKAADK